VNWTSMENPRVYIVFNIRSHWSKFWCNCLLKILRDTDIHTPGVSSVGNLSLDKLKILSLATFVYPGEVPKNLSQKVSRCRDEHWTGLGLD